MKRIEITIEDDAVPQALTALAELRGGQINSLKIDPVRTRARKNGGKGGSGGVTTSSPGARGGSGGGEGRDGIDD